MEITTLSEILVNSTYWIIGENTFVGEMGCRSCRNVVKLGRTPTEDNSSEKRKVQVVRIITQEKWVVGDASRPSFSRSPFPQVSRRTLEMSPYGMGFLAVLKFSDQLKALKITQRRLRRILPRHFINQSHFTKVEGLCHIPCITSLLCLSIQGAKIEQEHSYNPLSATRSWLKKFIRKYLRNINHVNSVNRRRHEKRALFLFLQNMLHITFYTHISKF